MRVLKERRAAGIQNIFGGVEDIASGAASFADAKQQIKLAKIENAEEGAKIESEEGGVTPGEFDHNSNPIDMVQDGEKIGEATGGELILPPDDVEEIRSALSEGDKNACF